MYRKPLLLLVFAVAALVAGPAVGAPRDAAAKRKIEAAIHKHYLETDFDRAETVLLGTIAACAKKCSKPVLAKAWLYVGIVRGSGRNDPRGAKKAFVKALELNPRIALDAALATVKTKKMFKQAQKSVGASGGDSGGVDLGGGEGSVGSMDCTPKISVVQTRRPVPVSCTVGGAATKFDLNYKAPGKPWKRIKMRKKRGAYQATIPCQATRRSGDLRFYVRGRDADGDIVEAYGQKREPIEMEIDRDTEEEPPAFPDRDPPRRCSRSKAASGSTCSEDDDCDGGLSCVEGACVEQQSCDVTEDCPGGNKCVDGYCSVSKKKKKGGAFKKSWLGFHFAYDFALVGGDDVCSLDSQQNKGFACFYADTEEVYRFDPNPDFANNISSGISPATFRLLLSFDQVFGENVTAGARLGYAFGGGPPAGVKKEVVKFFPFHAELRISYWFGDRPFSNEGLRPFIGVGGGAAQVDAKLPLKVADCAGTPSSPSDPGATTPQDQSFYQACSTGSQNGVELELDAYKKLGKTFVGVHGGIVYALSPDSGIQLNVNVMQMLPTSGQVFEPSLGYVQGI